MRPYRCGARRYLSALHHAPHRAIRARAVHVREQLLGRQSVVLVHRRSARGNSRTEPYQCTRTMRRTTVDRKIIGFHQDLHADWVADLDCGHPLHVRHRPPFNNRPWVIDQASRDRRIGEHLDCLRCDRAALPDGFAAYKRTPEFAENSIPEGLLRDHETKPGVWAVVQVSSGKLEYRDAQGRSETISPTRARVIPPQVRHCVRALRPVRFTVEFWRKE